MVGEHFNLYNESETSTSLYLVNGEYFTTISLSNGTTIAQKQVGLPAGEIPQVVDEDLWSSISNNWSFVDEAKASNQDIRLTADVFESILYKLGSQALAHPSVTAWLSDNATGKFGIGENWDELAAINAFRATPYFNDTTERQRVWATSSEAERAVQVQNSLGSIAELWRVYTGENLVLPETIGELQNDPQFKGWYNRAIDLAQGTISQTRLLNQWLQPLAEQIEGSPWNRRLLQEERAGKQEVIDLETKKGEIRDVGNRYGLSLSNEMLAKYGNDIINNDLSDEELEEKLDAQSLTLYPNKPTGMDWVTYSDPWRRAHATLYETSMPDHTDKDLAKALQDGLSVSDYETSIRKTNRWLGTENARDSMITELSMAGRRMGF